MNDVDVDYLELLEETINWRKRGSFEIARLFANHLLAKGHGSESSLWHTLGQIHTETGEWKDALFCYHKAVELIRQKGQADDFWKHQMQTSGLGLAQSYMRLGQFNEEVLNLWELGRLDVSWNPWPGSVYWNGFKPYPDSLLVQAEGGYGDTFMMMRWLPLLKERFAIKRVGLTVFKGLADFCDWQALGVDEVYRIGEDKIGFGEWEAATSILSMPAVFQMKGWEDVPEDYTEYIISGSLEGKPVTEEIRIGFCWRAEQNSSYLQTKSLPVEVADKVVDKLEVGPNIYSLAPNQKDLYNPGEFAQPKFIRYEPERMKTWADTAQYIDSMDFVLTVDTGVAHLAGLLGVPTLVLLPCSSCWRWGTAPRTSGPWYGPQLQYYRQPVPLQWDVDAIVNAAMERLSARTL